MLGSCSFMYMRHGDVYILGVTKSNANVMMGFQFMTNVRTSTPENMAVHGSAPSDQLQADVVLLFLGVPCAVLDVLLRPCAGGHPLPVLLWRRVQRAEHKEQLCAHLRAAG